MHLLVVSQYFYPESFKITDLVQALQQKGHKVTVFTGLPNYPTGKFFPGYSMLGPYQEVKGGSPIYRSPLIPRGKGGGFRLAVNYLSFAFLASLTIPFRCREKYDAIFVFQTSPVTVGLPAMAMKWARKIPIYFWVQDSWPETLEATGSVKAKPLLFIMGLLVRAIYASCDRILVQSKLFVDHIARVGGDVKKVSYFPNWAEDFYRPVSGPSVEQARQEFPPGFNILFGGNIGAAQSFDTILRAAQATLDYPNLNWIIIGDGRDKANVLEKIEQMGLQKKVYLLGSRPATQMPNYFAAADALLATLSKSKVFSMTIPSKIQTYMACERPILGALDGEGAKVIQEANCGLACNAEDWQALSKLAVEMSQMSKEQLSGLGQNGGRYCREQFDRSKLIDQLEAMLRRPSEGAIPPPVASIPQSQQC